MKVVDLCVWWVFRNRDVIGLFFWILFEEINSWVFGKKNFMLVMLNGEIFYCMDKKIICMVEL